MKFLFYCLLSIMLGFFIRRGALCNPRMISLLRICN
nr:MAG TPA: hypothetical protein [Caudoviricetes sp.]DAY37362.1 MAG TPA: hypothetical protein [Caudoviricetes sp.]